MSQTKKRATPGRVIKIGLFKIFNGPCQGCPIVVQPWIKQFCSHPLNSWYVEVDLDYANDWFNHYGMKETIDYFDEALELICDTHSDKWADYDEKIITEIQQQAIRLYGLLHSRWILQGKGLAQMKEKFEKGVFGHCPRYSCNDQNLLPFGQTVQPNHHSAKLYCPQCCDIYRPSDSFLIDGAHFGPAFPHVFLTEYPQFNTAEKFQPYQPKIFGYNVYEKGNSRLFYAHATNKPPTESSDEDSFED
ncbi:Casein kinase II subunit beta [Tritrichomonas foetus]|uniref:Casein kinase II subunit beta n=1 Tax=Tritrichomonas foetus TaxID=1144522 RepID=A0A1J4JL63_9EUKA|nr:Casein kinase II subunit beta [Tritrichomonas foetus]|eukprot:OHS98307.1 Casein kinase II subunit beta [Tritrichomonas foetus]